MLYHCTTFNLVLNIKVYKNLQENAIYNLLLRSID